LFVGVAVGKRECQRLEFEGRRRAFRRKSIYRPLGVGVFWTYFYAARVWVEVVQMDMVTVHTIIKGLYRRFDGK
jgi:hypothetical protein